MKKDSKPSIFNYDFDFNNESKSVCCEKYKKKGEKKCKKCPLRKTT